MKPIIKVENLSKEYRLGTVGTGTMKDDLKRWWYRVRGKEDPFLKVGEVNDRAHKGSSDYVWALKDINFEVQPGEVLGIIGRNGAGKSTLLKILSRVTEPTTGRVTMSGRVASLLEVGTGMHPELTGRENIYLNGAILGMRKAEINRKLDEIINFSGVERYIDSPVKRYSSGMHVRLGFAVAAHLEPEILIVDEVLAVGDAEFQRKCLGKMRQVSSKEGRTVLFVSHNIEAIHRLCDRALLLSNGRQILDDTTTSVVDFYLKESRKHQGAINLTELKRPENVDLLKRCLLIKAEVLTTGTSKDWTIEFGQELSIECIIKSDVPIANLILGVAISTITDIEIASPLSSDHSELKLKKAGEYKILMKFKGFYLLPGSYRLALGLRSEKGYEDYLPYIGEIEIIQSEKSAKAKTSTRKGIIVPNIAIEFKS
jgi:lipopolysaccharide transport system ATP-binding protein